MSIYKYLFVIFTAVLLLTSNADAKSKKYNLNAQHGPELKSADFPVRYKFEKATGHKWEKSTYSQREAFLDEWHKQLVINQLKAAQEKKSKSKALKESAKQKRSLDRAKRDKIKNEKAAKRNEHKAVTSKTRDFRSKVNKQQRKLRKLHR